MEKTEIESNDDCAKGECCYGMCPQNIDTSIEYMYVLLN